MTAPIRVTVTGGAGQIGYAMLFRIASGALFGPDQPVAVRILEIPQGMKAAEGVIMELNDCAFPLLASIDATDDLAQGFDGVRPHLARGGDRSGGGAGAGLHPRGSLLRRLRRPRLSSEGRGRARSPHAGPPRIGRSNKGGR